MKKKPLLIAMIIVCSFQKAVAQDGISTRVWDLASCIDYALEQNIQIKKDKIVMEESMIDTKTAKAALFPDLSFSTSHNVVNRPYSEQSSIIDGSNVISTSHKTNYTQSLTA